MPRPPRWDPMVRAARDEATLAVHLYNSMSEPRAFVGFVVHMHLAWLYLLHSRFVRDGVDYRYRDAQDGRRFVRVDGEYRRWELAKCVQERWPSNVDPVRHNLEFFIGLRNRIEHRHTEASFSIAFAGQSQALLVNFEDELVTTFGSKYSLATILRFPLFVGSFTDAGKEALLRLRDTLPPELKLFVTEFETALPEGVADDSRFELRLQVVLQQVQREDGGMAIQFTRWDDMSEEERVIVAALSRRGQVIIREQQRPVVGHGLLRARDAELRVAEALVFIFNSHHFLQSWQIKGIRPRPKDPHPERTDEKYCIYDELSAAYGYTEAWVNWLIRHCSTEDGFRAATGRVPKLKAAAETLPGI
jgi:hypothetical protein